MNRAQIIGNLGGDATVNQTQTGRIAIGFSVAVAKKWTDAQGQQQEKTTWFRCTIWKKAGESTNVAQYLKKGTKVFCEGEIEARAYQGNDGAMQASLELNVVAATMQLLGSPQGQQAAPAPAAAYPTQAAAAPRPAPAPAAYPQQQPAAYPAQQFVGASGAYMGGPSDDVPF